jgi:Predicted nucleotide-binding protein containing TIR-like domain
MAKPKLFIGSSVEGLEVAYAIQENLKFVSEVTVWDQGVFNLSETSLESLITALESSDFGVFVFSPDDHIKIRGKKDLAVRDNVLFELGLFVGKLGRKRSFIVIPDNKEFHLPTDLIGMTPAKYDPNRTDKNIQAGTGSACHKIRDSIVKQGVFNVTNEAPEDAITSNPDKSNNKGDWFDYIFFSKDYDKGISLLKKKIRYEKKIDEKIHLKSMICYAEFQKDSLIGIKEYEKLLLEYPTNSLSYIACANNFYWNNSFIKSLEIVEKGLFICDRKVTLTNLKAKNLWAINKKEDAIDFLKQTLESTPNVELFISLADYYTEINDKNGAINLLHKAYFIFPKNEDVMYKLARLAYDVNQKEICVFLYTELLYTKPEYPTYWCLLGNAYLDLQFDNLALSAYEKAADLSKQKQGWIYDNIGNLYNNRNLYDKKH